MMQQYKKTFWRIQSLILIVTCAVFFATDHRLPAVAVFFAVMQVGAILGAMWAVRLKSKVELYR
jgi:uncharacterized membrane protein YqjE